MSIQGISGYNAYSQRVSFGTAPKFNNIREIKQFFTEFQKDIRNTQRALSIHSGRPVSMEEAESFLRNLFYKADDGSEISVTLPGAFQELKRRNEKYFDMLFPKSRLQ